MQSARLHRSTKTSAATTRLTNRLRATGCRIVDAIWLATRARQGEPTLDVSPTWPEQLMARDTDARVV